VEEFWVVISSTWPNIEQILVRGDAATSLIDALAQHTDLFCHLNSLEIVNAKLVKQNMNVAHTLSKRLSFQGSALRVAVKDCRVQKECARGMAEKFGARFEWDEVVNGKVASVRNHYREKEDDWKRWPDDLTSIPMLYN
jgi:hypothetical protein